MLILKRPWTQQPHAAVNVHKHLQPIGGLLPGGYGLFDSHGIPLTVGTGITTGIDINGAVVRSTITNGGLTRTIQAITNHPFSFVWRGSVANNTNIQVLGSIATAADKMVRVYVNGGSVKAQHIGVTASSDANATTTWAVNTMLTVVAVFATPTDVRVYASGSNAVKSAQNTTNVGELGGLSKLSFCAYDGSTKTYPLDGNTQLAQWLRIALTDQQAWNFLRNPWQLFAPQRIYIPTAAAPASSLPTLSASTFVPGSITATGWRPRVTAEYA